MAVLRILLPALVLVGVLASPTKERSTSTFETAAVIASNGYPSETHHVTTSDGYILEMHRIPHGKDQSPSANKPVVFLMHGLTASSDSYIALGPELAPGYNLADAGFDIWMGNARGNVHSRYHVSLNPDDSREKLDFFDFSFEEIAVHDLPAMIDYVLKFTGQEKLHYIGHSQGGTVFLILNSMLPEYNEKIASAHLLAGVGYQKYFPNAELRSLALLTDVIYGMAVLSGFVEIFPPSSTNGVALEERVNYCTGDVRSSYMCELVGVKHLMRGVEQESDSSISNILDYESAGAAVKQFAHYGQNIRDKSFRRWSYNTIQNLIVYGTGNAPEYDLSLITINVTMHYTVSDILLDEKDVLDMANVMPNTSVRKVARETFLHGDFVAATDAKVLVTDYIIEALKRDSGMAILDSEKTEVENSEIEESYQNANGDNFDINIEALPVMVEGVVESAVTDSANSYVLSNVFKMYLIISFILFLR